MLKAALFTLFAVLCHDNGESDWFVVDYNLTEADCAFALEGLAPIMAANVTLECAPE